MWCFSAASSTGRSSRAASTTSASALQSLPPGTKRAGSTTRWVTLGSAASATSRSTSRATDAGPSTGSPSGRTTAVTPASVIRRSASVTVAGLLVASTRCDSRSRSHRFATGITAHGSPSDTAPPARNSSRSGVRIVAGASGARRFNSSAAVTASSSLSTSSSRRRVNSATSGPARPPGSPDPPDPPANRSEAGTFHSAARVTARSTSSSQNGSAVMTAAGMSSLYGAATPTPMRRAPKTHTTQQTQCLAVCRPGIGAADGETLGEPTRAARDRRAERP